VRALNVSAVLFLFSWMSINAEEPMIVAHRGASKDAPENTIPAFLLAWEQGADAIEGDFHLTKDGHIVCIHDGDTKRVANTNMVVRNSTLADLRTLSIVHDQENEPKVTVIPTIAEVLAIIPQGKTIYVEVKCGVEIIPGLLMEIDKSGLKEDQVVFISFKEAVIQELKARAPQYKTSWLCSFNKQKSGAITPSSETVLSTLERIRADGLSSNITVPESLIETLRKQGYKWHVWTVDEPNTAKRMKALGAASITTKAPRIIKEAETGMF